MSAATVEPRSEVCAVIVTYNPDGRLLKNLLTRLSPQVARIVVVDNASTSGVEMLLNGDIEDLVVNRLERNQGIASAQNIGIEWAARAGFRFVLLSDQDSEPSGNMVSELLAAVQRLQSTGDKVAAVGPCHIDPRRSAGSSFIVIGPLGLRYRKSADDESVVEVNHLIASGTLVPIDSLRAIGNMMEELFIDYVDIEWGLRARSKGYKSFGVLSAKLTHQIGDSPLHVLGRSFEVHSPLRHYYLFRNSVWLWKQPYSPTGWRVFDAMRMVRRFVFYATFGKPRSQHVAKMLRGVRDGCLSKLGPY